VTVLVDTSVWRRFFSGKGGAKTKRTLSALLDEDDALLIHVAVIGELVLGESPR
jgi:predicted nucleic acid-binding protein